MSDKQQKALKRRKKKAERSARHHSLQQQSEQRQLARRRAAEAKLVDAVDGLVKQIMDRGHIDEVNARLFLAEQLARPNALVGEPPPLPRVPPTLPPALAGQPGGNIRTISDVLPKIEPAGFNRSAWGQEGAADEC